MARICLIRQWFFPHDVRVRREVEALTLAGHEVTVICLRQAKGPAIERQGQLTVYRVPIARRRTSQIQYVIQYAAFFVVATALAGILHLRRRFDLVQVNSMPDALVFSAIIPKLLGARVLLDLHECMPEFYAIKYEAGLHHPFVRLVARLEQASIRFADFAITCTEQMREAFTGRGAPRDKIAVIMNSANENEFDPGKYPPAPHDPREFRLICHGSIERRYGIDTAVRAVGLLRNEIPGLSLDIYGEGTGLEEIRSLIRELHLEDRVHLAGRYVALNEVVQAIANADAGVVAMRRDIFRDLTHCNKMFDFISMRKPAIVSRTRSVEAYFASSCFQMFTSNDDADLARAIRELYLDPGLRARLVHEATRANEPYRWPIQRALYQDVIERMASGEARRPAGAFRTDADPAVTRPEVVRAPTAKGVRAATAPNLFSANTPAAFWRLQIDPEPSPADWSAAVRAAAPELPAEARAAGDDIDMLLLQTLGEGQFGPDHWRLRRSIQLYYAMKPFLPRRLTMLMRRMLRGRVEAGSQLRWPIDDRYARFQWAVVQHLLRSTGRSALPFIHFWPNGYRFAFVLTHDVETAEGQDRVRELADLDASYGFRSSFNFVAEGYRLDRDLLAELRERGFEIGVHGVKHDSRSFRSKRRFDARAERINRHMAALGAVGFRSPMTHRHPEWMQSLALEYDLSFFDTDPYEPIPGGTMSLWPFQLGRFCELPYTLPQDHTLTAVLGETTRRLWLTKVDLIQRYGGMALVNSHPDYLVSRTMRQVYEGFLEAMSRRADAWNAPPAAVARWWRARATAPSLAELPGGALSAVESSGVRWAVCPSAAGQAGPAGYADAHAAALR